MGLRWHHHHGLLHPEKGCSLETVDKQVSVGRNRPLSVPLLRIPTVSYSLGVPPQVLSLLCPPVKEEVLAALGASVGAALTKAGLPSLEAKRAVTSLVLVADMKVHQHL